MNTAVAGATGLIGRSVCVALAQAGHTVSALVRNASRAAQAITHPAVSLVEWDPMVAGAWEEVVGKADVVINLAGEPIAARRWNADIKKRLRSSRLDTTRALVRARADSGARGGVLINASAVGYYGDRGDAQIAEDTPPGNDFLGQLCAHWEGEALACREREARVVLLRLGIVLSRDGGALEKMVRPYRWFVGGPIGTGRQWVPWVHINDVVGITLWAVADDNLQGPVNVCAPNPVRMRDFATSLGIVLRRPALFRVPPAALKLVVGEMAEALLASQRVVPRVAMEAGYEWQYTLLEPALHSVLR